MFKGWGFGGLVLFFVGLGFFLGGIAVLVLTAAFPPSSVRLIPATLFGALLFLSIGAVLVGWGFAKGQPSDEPGQQRGA